MQETIDPSAFVSGRARQFMVTECSQEQWVPPTSKPLQTVFPSNELWTPVREFKRNKVTMEWGALVGQLLTKGETKYRIAGMYLEFENVGSPGDPVSAPTLTRTRTVDYYNSLAGSGARDYLRVPMTATTFDSSNAVTFPKGNRPTFFARSQGLQGVHGKTFSDSVNSVIFGASLVAYVDDTDATQDLIFSSIYFDTDEQQPKLATSQVGIEWELTLG